MSTEKGQALYDRRHHRGPAPEPTPAEVRDSAVVRGRLIREATSATKLVTLPSGNTGRVEDRDARRRARELLASHEEATATLDQLEAGHARSGVGSYDDLGTGQRMSGTPAP